MFADVAATDFLLLPMSVTAAILRLRLVMAAGFVFLVAVGSAF